MRGTVEVIATPELAIGFALAGLPTADVRSLEEGVGSLEALLRRTGVAVILVEETILETAPETLQREAWRRPLPIVVPFPRPVWVERPRPPEEFILEILQRAIGYRVRLR